ncbi:MAG: Y-family DNA polymerase [Phycisphaerales bacterium JB059]
MKRMMSVWFPNFAVELVRRRDRHAGRSADPRPLLLTTEEHQRQVVAACCERAAGAGVVPGLPVPEARGLIRGEARVEPARPSDAEAALWALATWSSRRLAPTVAPDAPDGLLLDVTGCGPVHGGEPRLLEVASAAFRALGFTARGAIAPTLGAAWATARFGGAGPRIVGEGEVREAIASLPVQALRLDPQTVAGLNLLGIERIEHVVATPRSTLPARFGEQLLLRLDQAMGHAIETIHPVRPTDPPMAERLFDGPTTRREVLESTLRALLESVCVQLAARESGARRIGVEFDRSDEAPTGFALVLSHPSRDPGRLWSLARPHLERVHLGFGVEGIRVKAAHLARLHHEQHEQWRDGEAGPHAGTARAVSRLTDTLVNRLGAHRVRVFDPAESYIPERASRFRAPVSIGGRLARFTPTSADRPTLLFEAPEPIRVMALTPDGPVRRVTWRGEELEIIACVGPERLGPEWWVGDRSGRDYFKAQDERGRWLWIRRDLTLNQWSIHGVWA